MTIHEIAGQGFTHQQLWNCTKTLLTQPETQSPTDGYFRMAGMLMAYFTYEAYLNLVGPRIDGAAWKNERDFFSRPPYQGTRGKLKWICERIGIEVERDKRPYQTIEELRKLRDFLAHGKPEAYAYHADVEEGQEPDMFDGLNIYKMVTRENADRALKDTEEFIEYLHVRITEKRSDDGILFKGKALHFPLAMASGSTRRT